jgi:hypothetical protein
VRGRIVVGGDVEVRMWTVGRMVILATGPEEAERALLTLVSHAEPELRTEAGRLAEALRGERAAAA